MPGASEYSPIHQVAGSACKRTCRGNVEADKVIGSAGFWNAYRRCFVDLAALRETRTRRLAASATRQSRLEARTTDFVFLPCIPASHDPLHIHPRLFRFLVQYHSSWRHDQTPHPIALPPNYHEKIKLTPYSQILLVPTLPLSPRRPNPRLTHRHLPLHAERRLSQPCGPRTRARR